MPITLRVSCEARTQTLAGADNFAALGQKPARPTFLPDSIRSMCLR